MPPAGRKPKQFDKSIFENLCGLMCTEIEICSVFNTTDKTLNRWLRDTYDMDFSEAFQKFSSNGKIALRRAQYKAAVERGNTSMLIWLGKQWLNQTDHVVLDDHLHTDKDPLSLALEALEKK